MNNPKTKSNNMNQLKEIKPKTNDLFDLNRIEGEWKLNHGEIGSRYISRLGKDSIEIKGVDNNGIIWTIKADLGSKGAI